MDPTFRKIDLQSPADLAYIESNVRRAASQKIDHALPPSAAPEGEDELRKKVEGLIDEYVRTTFEGVRANVTVNGMDEKDGIKPQDQGEAPTLEFEPLDTRLADRIRALESTKESLTTKLADLRRTGPHPVAHTYQTQLLARREQQDQQLAAQQETMIEDAKGERLALTEPARGEEVAEMWEVGTGGLVELKGGLTETVGRVERAGRVGGHVVGLKGEGG
ncbi:hypothetical protein P152DRAFT_427959 [Eremomyces bilateralis CBS 781.70]|uniref:Kinetochore protein mis14 n=1 Tax=Eremomyces bilateralis CBS 781.70 TaxID=1392243 RepID=A0A6G1GDG9_9PEZI|nr:uncharacterized protein P152DRAFT_427959 [Eremomyces bilateralis CBS 781.70]KAF1816147.1 hypothetical protein P152DRAFT_427959 [Eremomyces bilateralis CBS 781.70]